MSSLGNVAETIKEKLAGPKVVEHEEIRYRVKPAGEEGDVEAKIKTSDQMHGQAFNDVGEMGEEGSGPIGRDDRHGKM